MGEAAYLGGCFAKQNQWNKTPLNGAGCNWGGDFFSGGTEGLLVLATPFNPAGC